MIHIIDGKKVSEELLEKIKSEIEESGIHPKLVVISTGVDDASKVYIRNKKRACEKVGIEFRECNINDIYKDVNGNFNKDIFKFHVTIAVTEANKDNLTKGIIVQSPILGMTKKDEKDIFNIISPEKDVDAFSDYHISKLYNRKPVIISCTPQGILHLLDYYNINVSGKQVLVIGRSNIVGKPLSLALLNRDATVTIAHSKTEDLKELTKNSDIIISAVGKPKFINRTYLSPRCTCIIDVGMNRDENGKLCGDCDFDDIIKFWKLLGLKDRYITPVPGGVGPMTVASLIENVLKLCYSENKIEHDLDCLKEGKFNEICND